MVFKTADACSKIFSSFKKKYPALVLLHFQHFEFLLQLLHFQIVQSSTEVSKSVTRVYFICEHSVFLLLSMLVELTAVFASDISDYHSRDLFDLIHTTRTVSLQTCF